MCPIDAGPDAEFTRNYGEAAWADWRQLLAHFELGEGFALLVLLLPGAVGADVCRRQLEAYLAGKGKKLLRLDCEHRNQLELLAQLIFDVQPPADAGALWISAPILITDPELPAWQQAWRRGLGLLNQQRNPFRRRFGFPVVFVGAPWLQEVMRESAPDVWSVRTGVVTIVPGPVDAPAPSPAGATPRVREPGFMGEAAADPEYAMEQAERLRRRGAPAKVVAELFWRAGNGFYERSEFTTAEVAYRLAADLYAELAAGSPAAQGDQAAGPASPEVPPGNLGRRAQMLAPMQEAIELVRQLVAREPERFRLDLAVTLNNLGNRLGKLGRSAEALAPTQEAVDLCRQLAAGEPERFRPVLATALNNLGIRLGNLGRYAEALVAAQEALKLFQQVASGEPDRSRPDLANSCGTLGSVHQRAGNHREARAAFAEGLAAIAPCLKASPQAHARVAALLLQEWRAAAKETGDAPSEAEAATVAVVEEALRATKAGGGP